MLYRESELTYGYSARLSSYLTLIIAAVRILLVVLCVTAMMLTALVTVRSCVRYRRRRRQFSWHHSEAEVESEAETPRRSSARAKRSLYEPLVSRATLDKIHKTDAVVESCEGEGEGKCGSEREHEYDTRVRVRTPHSSFATLPNAASPTSARPQIQ